MPVIDERREKILKGIKNIPVKNLVNFIMQGVVRPAEVMQRLQELHDTARQQALTKELENFDHTLWKTALQQNSVESYRKYVDTMPNGLHAEECRKLLAVKEQEQLQQQASADEAAWQQAAQQNTKQSMEAYLAAFPYGAHRAECEAMLNDLPWMETRKRNTIAGYEEYMRQHPGQHVAECRGAILALNDDNDWLKAERAGTTAALENYLRNHPEGKFVFKAQTSLAARMDRDRVVKALEADRNAFAPKEIQREVQNRVVSWADLRRIFSDDELKAIQSFTDVTPLPYSDAPKQLQRDTTEVYFWGTPSSGKTCALGALLSAAFHYGILTEQPCQGAHYMDRLSNIFINDGICVLPQGTPDYSIQEMAFTLRDRQRNEHPLACIDLAGEVFRALYRKQNNIPEENFVQEQALKHTLSYLADSHNRKIHFFIIAYGEHMKEWDGLRMHNYLASAVTYLRDNKIIRRGTNGIYILVTKSDLMPCSPGQRKDYATQYVQRYMPSLCNSLAQICHDSDVQDFDILPFSLGDVFAQKLCHFESDNTDSLLNKLILTSGYIHRGLLSFLNP
ncbi:MAG: hypothetical protein J5486_04100 [Bacteroidaceae bacterium]|nr:hypothetical protein [Bacteroidaceae bacterium]